MSTGAIFFDVDGVLLNSLPSHLAICRDLARAYGLNIEIPSERKFRETLASEKKISPMYYFFSAVGFPETFANRAVIEYENIFQKKYKPKPYAKYKDTIEELSKCGWKMGIVTSNISANIFPELDDILGRFEQDCLFTLDMFKNFSKSECLLEGAKRIGKRPESCYYLGDLLSDAHAAKEAGFKFLGAAYGWGIRADDTRFTTINRLDELPLTLNCRQS